MHPRRLVALSLLVAACEASVAPPPPTPDAATADVHAPDRDAPDASVPDVSTVDASAVDASAVDASLPACTADTAGDLLRALRAPRAAGVSAVAAPGQRFDDLRTRTLADPALMALAQRVRTSSRGALPTLAAGDDGTYQVVASRALQLAFVAWLDRDMTAAQAAVRALAAAAVAPAWLRTATEVPIRVGASLVDLAAAVDLLASVLPAAELDVARAHVGTALTSVVSWLRTGGEVFVAFHSDNHGMRLGAGLVATAMVAPAGAVDDEVLGYALAHMGASVQRQTGGAEGWAEGTTYFSYAFEVSAPALLAVDRAWSGDDRRCVRCPSFRLSSCGAAPTPIVRPSRDPLLRDLVRWAASLETRNGWLLPTDDSRLAGTTSPLLERMVEGRAFARWSAMGPQGTFGGSVDVTALVALSLASPDISATLTPRALWPAAGTGRLDATTADGAPVEAFMVAEHGEAHAGHERPDPLALTFVVDGSLMLGASGYGAYDARGPLARGDASSVITVEGVLDRAAPAGTGGPDATLTGDARALAASFAGDGVTVSRSLSVEAGAMVVRDRVEVTGAARDVAWHWHLRGALDATGFAWTRDALRCTATQEGGAPPLTRETAPHFDQYSPGETHPVVRQSARLAAGAHTLTTRVACTRR